MTISTVGSTTASGNNPTSGTWTLPAGWQPGDLVVVWLYARSGTYAISNPAGITIKHNSNNSNNGRLFIGYRYLQAGDTSFNWTRTTGSSNADVLWGVVVLRGTVGSGDPFNASTGATPTTGTGADPDPTAVTPTIAGSTVWAIGGKRDDAGGTFNPPANFTLAGAVQSTAGQDASAATILRHNRPASSENPGPIDLGTVSAAWAAWTGAISPGAGSVSTFTYDYADRLRTATVGATTETYGYAGDGVRVTASTGALPSQTTKYLWDRVFGLPQLVIERDGADALLRSYRYGWDLVNQTAGANTYYYQHDGLGSVSDMTGVSANSLIWSEYYPYGQVRQAGVGAGAPAVNPFGFTGEQLDGLTGLYHLRARQYDPGTGRFLTTDPVAQPLMDAYVGAYLYARGNPVVLVDPSGQCPPCLAIAATILVGALAGGGSYTVGVGVSNVITTGEVSLEGWDPVDAGLSAAAGAVTGGTASYLTTAGRIAYGALAGFDATIWSMAAGGRRDPTELLAGTVFGGIGGAYDAGPRVIGFIRGLLGGGLLNAAQMEFQKWLERLMGTAWGWSGMGSLHK
jgi:RHS repeat-associated protein